MTSHKESLDLRANTLSCSMKWRANMIKTMQEAVALVTCFHSLLNTASLRIKLNNCYFGGTFSPELISSYTSVNNILR